MFLESKNNTSKAFHKIICTIYKYIQVSVGFILGCLLVNILFELLNILTYFGNAIFFKTHAEGTLFIYHASVL